MKKPATGVWNRSRKILGTAGRMAAKEAAKRAAQAFEGSKAQAQALDLKTKVEQAALLAESLGELKGAAMKAGQMLSIDAGDMLPEEVTRVLAKLQNQAEPVEFEVLESVLREDLGEQGLRQLTQLNPTPSASASIGQVHEAFVDGERVAVKIQYPGITDSIDSDLRVLKRLAGTWLGISGRNIELDAIFEELGTVLKLEGDYRHELACLERYQGIFADSAEYSVPRAYPSLCSPRVLTMSFEEGVTLDVWRSIHSSTRDRTMMAERLLDLYCTEFFDYGIVQTDPNPANFLVHEDKLVLLDFGATITYDQDFRHRYVRLLRTFATRDEKKIIDAGIEQKLIDERESTLSKQRFAEMLIQSIEPFEPENQPFIFADEDYARRARDTGIAFVRSLKYSPPPRAILFLHRKLGGIFNLLKRMDVKLDLVPYWKRMIAN